MKGWWTNTQQEEHSGSIVGKNHVSQKHSGKKSAWPMFLISEVNHGKGIQHKNVKQLLQKHYDLIAVLNENSSYSDQRKSELASVATNLIARNVFANYVVSQLKAEAVLPLPADILQLIGILYRYMKSLPLSQESKRLYQDTHESIVQAMDHLEPGKSSIQWLFASKDKKKRGRGAYAYLKESESGLYAWQIRTLSNDIQEIDRLTSETLRQDFDSNRSAYRSVLYNAAHSAVQNGAPIREIGQLCDQHRSLIAKMDETKTSIERSQGQIKAAAERLVAFEMLKLLKDIPIEELGRSKAGIRVKSLREHGYTSIADVYCATKHNLSSVYGISEDMAHTIKHNADELAEQAKNSIKIRLSMDDQNDDATKLVAAICTYRRQLILLDELKSIRDQHEKSVSSGLRDMQKIENGINWVFIEEAERQRLISTYQYLNGLVQGEYATSIDELTYSIVCPDSIDASDEWKDFEHNSILYFNILEELVPGLLGNDDGLYGLPENLAREIQDECFFPDGLKCELRRYQEWGVKYVLHQERVLLGDEMGLGKTVQAIATMVSLRNTGATHFLVVCPASVLPNWCKEIAQKSKLRVTKIHGQDRMDAFEEWEQTGGAGVTTFETTGYLKMEDDERFDLLIVDEAHYIKNQEARRTVNVKRLGEHTNRMLFMTGTALENNVDEMISLIQVLQPTVASQLHSIAFMSSAPQFREKVAPVYYRRKREDVLTELPELIENTEWCALSPEEERIYERTVLSKRYADIRRVSWNMDDLNKSCKAVRMREIIEEAEADGRKTIVFSFFLDTMRRIRAYLGSRCIPPINGSVAPQRRQEIIDEFDNAPAGSVLLAQIQSGGTGLNIQSASVVIICEPQLKPSIENQAISRAYRMGQARNVLVYRLLCEDTIDERIAELLAEKQAVFDAFADKSVAAAATENKEVELDDKTMGKLVEEEIERINAKNGVYTSSERSASR